jgi:molybdate transport system substrate-binding protein
MLMRARVARCLGLLLLFPGAGTPSAQHTLTVFAAASLTEAFGAIGRLFEQRHPEVSVRFNFAGSQVLATQLAQGARADVFASADRRWMRYAAENRLLAGAPSTFARNRLVVVLPRSNPAGIERLQDLARPGIKLVLAGRQVPVGAYSRELLARLARAPGFPARYDQRVLANLVSEEENVRGVAAKVQLREADAGVVYQSDVTASMRPAVRLLEIPDRYNPTAEYPIAAVAGGAGPEAGAFIALVLSEEGQRLLARQGFAPPAPGAE